jgi:hypothetical protein
MCCASGTGLRPSVRGLNQGMPMIVIIVIAAIIITIGIVFIARR